MKLTPRTKQACAKVGISPEELIFKSKEDIRKEHVKTKGFVPSGKRDIEDDVLEMKWKAYEEKRKAKFAKVMKTRDTLTTEEMETA